VKPIVYYIDPATPTKWIPYLKKGIEDWQPAFESAGFKNAIIAQEAPANDPLGVRRCSVFCSSLVAVNHRKCIRPNVHDPRSGEILNADIQFYHNVSEPRKNWYFRVRQAHSIPRAQKLPFPDELMGELLRYVCLTKSDTRLASSTT
jgi:hypothetical protein